MKIKKLIVVIGCCIIMLFCLVFVGCKRDTAKASIYSHSVLLELPAFALTIDGNVGYSSTMYLGYDTDYYVYYLRSGTGLQPYYYKGYNGSSNEYPHYTYGVTSINDITSNVFSDMAFAGGSRLSFYTYDNNTGTYTFDYIISNTAHIDIGYSIGELTYTFYDLNNNPICHVRFDNLKTLPYVIQNNNYTMNIVSTNILLDQETLLNNAYYNGYNDAYNIGYSAGYIVGVNDGFGATTPFDVFIDTIGRFLDIELFGGFRISTLFYIGFGMILLGIVIKVFLGG